MWLPADLALLCAALLAAFGNMGRHFVPRISEATREAAYVFLLYALWRLFNVVELHLGGAYQNGRQIWRLERAVGVGSERWLQTHALPHPLVVQFANAYYAIAHVPATIVCLFWLFFRHRRAYRHWRSVLAVTTAISVIMHLVPVAPPRLFPDLGFVDTAVLYHQSVYGNVGAGVSDQFAAMPSIHAAWALLICAAALSVSRSRWRWLAVGHAVLTLLSIAITANHWWLDSLAAAALVGAISSVRRRLMPSADSGCSCPQLARRPIVNNGV